MFVLMSSKVCLKLGHLGSKTRSPVQISLKSCYHSSGHIFEAIIMNPFFFLFFSFFLIMNLAQNVCRWVLGYVWNWVMWGQKLGHQAKSAENVNTLAVTFLKQSSWILLNMFVLMISRSSSKLGHLGSKTRSPGKISGKSCYHSSGYIFEAIIINLAQNVCLDF